MPTTTELFEEIRRLTQGDITRNLARVTSNLTYLLESIYRGTAPAVDIVEVANNYVATSTNSLILVDATAGDVDITLPLASSLIDVTYGSAKIFYIKKADSSGNAVNVIVSGSDTIEGAGALNLTSPLQSVLLVPDGNDWFILATNGGGGGGGSGDVVGPASATDNAVARYNLTTGKLIQNSLVTISDTGSISLPGGQTVDGRDVSVDGTKLDGIEAGADVTDATNVAAAGAIMDSDFAGTDAGVLRRTGAGTYVRLKDNLSATAAPTANDDSGDGYSVGSQWCDVTNDQVYFCIDATVAAAVWRLVPTSLASPDNESVTIGSFTSVGGSLLATHVVADVDSSGGTVDIALPAFVDFAGDRVFVIHKRTTDANIVRLTGFSVNGSASPYTLPGSDGAHVTWFVRRNAAGTWYCSPGAVDDVIIEPASSATGDILYFNGTVYTRLPIGSSGHVLTVSGGNPAWAAAAGGGASIPAIGGMTSATYLDDARYWSLGSDPLAIANGTLALLCNPTLGAEQYDNRYFCGTRNNTGTAGGGVCFYTTSAFNPISRGFDLVTDLGNARQIMWTDRALVGKWTLLVLTWSHSGGTITVRFYVNGTPVNEGTVLGANIAAGGNLCIGTSAEAAVTGGDGANEGWFNGMGYATRALPYEQVAELTDAVFQANQLVDIPTGGSWTGAWRVGSGEPGSSWAATFGTGTLTRTGTAAGFANKYAIWG